MANYELFKRKIKRAEGGYQALSKDDGNYNSLNELVGTNYGISAETYERYINRPPTIADMKAITQQQAYEIYKKDYWGAVKADLINSQKVAETFVDHAINAGVGGATKVMQRVLNNTFGKSLVVDGAPGPKTLFAINSVDAKDLFIAYSQGRKHHYSTMKRCTNFCPIWHRRVDELANDHSVNISTPVKPVAKPTGKKKAILILATVAISSIAIALIYKRKKNDTTTKVSRIK